MKDKRGDIEISELLKWLLLLAGLTLAVILAFMNREKIFLAIESIAEFLRFGR